MTKPFGALAGLLAGIGLTSGAIAQGVGQGDAGASDDSGDYFRRDRNTSVTQRKSARHDEGAMRLGLLLIEPSLSLSAGAADNFAAAENGAENSLVYSTTGELAIKSDWARHGFNATLVVPSTTYDGSDSLSNYYTTTDYLASVDARLDIGRGLNIGLGVNYADRAEAVGFAAPGITLAEPARTTTTGASLSVSQTFNRLRVSAAADYAKGDYEDVELASGASINVDTRDVTNFSYSLRADVALTENTSLFVSATSSQLDHELDPPEVALDRDSDGVAYFAGVSFDASDLARGEISVGRFEQTSDNPAVPEQSGLAISGELEFFPDELVTISIGAERSIQESNTAAAATVVGTDANVEVVYEFRSRLNLSVGAGYGKDEYVEIDREDERWVATAGLSYEVNRNVAVTLSVGHNEQSSQGADLGRNYDTNVGLVGVRLRR